MSTLLFGLSLVSLGACVGYVIASIMFMARER